ncbi:myb domain protein 103 [Euphorbia peplus]|nr:myb domain protein 103 [Euphorbia peplus]
MRPPCCGKLNVKKEEVWTPEEDAKVVANVSKHGTRNWTDLPKKAGPKKCGKSCRLRPDLKHANFTPHEEELIVRLHSAIGSRWSMIAQQLPGRTINDVKNYWNTKLKKKLLDMGIDPVTHKPFSQILSRAFNMSHENDNTIRVAHKLNESGLRLNGLGS